MSDSQPLSTLTTYTAKTWTTGETIDASDLGDGSAGEFYSIDGVQDEHAAALADIQSCRSSASHAPTDNTIEGQIVHDSGTGEWYGDPDGSGADDQVLTELTAYGADCATAGSATFRVGGPLVDDTTQVALAGSTGVLESYTLPAGTLARDGQYVKITAWGSKAGGTADSTIQTRFNTGAEGSHTLADDVTAWYIEWYIVRTGAATQKFVSTITLNRDDTGDTDFVVVGTDAETLSGALAIDLNLSAINASDTVTKEGMIVEFGNY